MLSVRALSPAHGRIFDCKHPADFESDAKAGGRKAGAILVRFNERDEEGGKQVVNFALALEGSASPTPDRNGNKILLDGEFMRVRILKQGRGEKNICWSLSHFCNHLLLAAQLHR